MDITVDRIREAIDFFNEDTSVQYRMWYNSMINTIILARITTPPLDVDIYHMQDSLEVFEDIKREAEIYLQKDIDGIEESAILNAIFTVAELVVDV